MPCSLMRDMTHRKGTSNTRPGESVRAVGMGAGWCLVQRMTDVASTHLGA
jgi:hypothetical protein